MTRRLTLALAIILAFVPPAATHPRTKPDPCRYKAKTLAQLRRPHGGWTTMAPRRARRLVNRRMTRYRKAPQTHAIAVRYREHRTEINHDTPQVPGLLDCLLDTGRFPRVNRAQAHRIAMCESHADPEARNPNGLYHGVYQVSMTMWRAQSERFLGRVGDVYNAWEHVFVVFSFVNADDPGWSHWECQ